MSTDPTKHSQCDQILAALAAGQSITPLDALHRFGCMRLGSRINDLRNEGHPIETVMVTANGKRFASYHLNEKVEHLS